VSKNNFKTDLKSSGKEISTQADLYWFTLIQRATSNPQKPLGIPLCNQSQITKHTLKEVILNPSITHTSLNNYTTKLRTTSDSAHPTSISEIQEIRERITLD